MKKGFICALLMLIMLLGLTACADPLKKVSKGLSTYTLSLEYDGERTVTAQQTIDYVNPYEVALPEIVLHLYANAYREGAEPCPVSDLTDYGGIEITSLTVGGESMDISVGGTDQNILMISLSEPLYPERRLKIELAYTLTLSQNNHRLGINDSSVSLGNFYPIASVYKNGEFLTDPYYANGDPFHSECANYEVSLSYPEGYTVAASGTPRGESSNGGKRAVSFSAQAIRSFAISLSKDYAMLSQALGKVEVNYFHIQEEDAAASLATAVSALKTFNELFGQYPYPVLNVVSTDFYTGGMEYPRLVLINRTLGRAEKDTVIAHEIAHQWWYGVVGNDEVREAWIDESLAEYSTTLFFEKNPSYGIGRDTRCMGALRSYLNTTRVFEAVQGKVDTSMNRRVCDFATQTEYACMVYVKGQLMWDNVRNLVGDKAFMAALKTYYSQNKFKNVSAAHLIGAFESASSRDLEGVFQSWLTGKVILTDLIKSE